jgi:hypothetical protein
LPRYAWYADPQGAPAFDFEFQVDGFVLSGVRDPQVTITGNRIEVVGGVTVGGQESASNGSPYRINVTATDEADTLHLRVWHQDEDGAERVFYETEADQALLSGDVRVRPWGASTTIPRLRDEHDRSIPRRAPGSE